MVQIINDKDNFDPKNKRGINMSYFEQFEDNFDPFSYFYNKFSQYELEGVFDSYEFLHAKDLTPYFRFSFLGIRPAL